MADIDLRGYLGVVWKWAWLVALAMILAGVASYQAVLSVPPTYLSATTIMVGEDAGNPGLTADDLAVSQRAANSYAVTVRRQPVLEATIRRLGLRETWQDLQQRVQVNRIEGTQLVEIRVTDTNPARAKAIAEELTNQLIAQSPTAEATQQQEERRQFIRKQLDQLQTSMQQAEKDVADKRAQVQYETSARAVLDLQDEIRALEAKLETWRSTYVSLLASYQGKRQPNAVTVIEPASVPSRPVGPNVAATVLVAVAAGLLLALAGIFVAEYLNDVLRTEEDVLKVAGLPNLGIVPHLGRIKPASRALVTAMDPDSPATEAYRVLRANVRFSLTDDRPAVLLVTSPGMREGKSMTSANLAASFAQAGQQTILIDADLRRPRLHEVFGIANSSGLAQVLEPRFSQKAVDRAQALEELSYQVERALVPTVISSLRLLTSGPALPLNPAELLVSVRMDLLLAALRNLADVVIVDSPPLLPVVDATILAAKVEGVVLVIESGRTRRQAAKTAMQILRRAGANILGTALNAAPKGASHYYEYGYVGQRKHPDSPGAPGRPTRARQGS